MSPESRICRKRRRSASVASTGVCRSAIYNPPAGAGPSHLPAESKNPYAYPPNILRQFSLAGLPHDKPVPSAVVRDFPHRPLPETDIWDTSAKLDDDGRVSSSSRDSAVPLSPTGSCSKRASCRTGTQSHKTSSSAWERVVGVLSSAVRRCLAQGDVARARRAFGLLVRSRVRGKTVSLARDGLWVLGAEIIMATFTCKDDHESAEQAEGKEKKRMEQLRAYFGTLARLHPWSRSNRHQAKLSSASALDFVTVLFGFEVDAVYRAQKRAQGRVSDGEEDGVDEGGAGGSLGRRRKARVEALNCLRRVAELMDSQMEADPFSGDAEMLRLRGLVALYVADLVVPLKDGARYNAEMELGWRRARADAREMARRCFAKMGHVARAAERWLSDWINDFDGREDEAGGNREARDESTEDRAPRMFSSLVEGALTRSSPVRGDNEADGGEDEEDSEDQCEVSI